MTKDEALDLALEALESGQNHGVAIDKLRRYIEQTRSAPITKDELTEPLGCVVVRPLVANSTPPPAQPAPVQEPVAFNTGVPPLYPEMKDGETISVEYTTPPDVATPLAAQQDIQRLSALVRAQQITIDKLEAQRQWVGLTDEDKLMCWARATHDADVEHKTEHQCLMDYGTEIEAKLKEKNT